MDHRFRKLARAPLFIADDPTAEKEPRQINKSIVTFGREGYSVNDVQIPGQGNVSRRHCVVVSCRNDVWLYDLNSTGTHVNGQRVSGKLPLVGRSLVRIGDKELIITSEKGILL
jgi:pSer/pThr/pTyr-binding forkhead associated (FHA) protein